LSPNLGKHVTSRRTAAEAKRAQLKFVQLRWPVAEDPDEKVSHLDRALRLSCESCCTEALGESC
jgi:hypothetical protein